MKGLQREANIQRKASEIFAPHNAVGNVRVFLAPGSVSFFANFQALGVRENNTGVKGRACREQFPAFFNKCGNLLFRGLPQPRAEILQHRAEAPKIILQHNICLR